MVFHAIRYVSRIVFSFSIFFFSRGTRVKREGGEINGNKNAESEIINCSRGALLYGERELGSACFCWKEGSEARIWKQASGGEELGCRMS